MTDQDIIDTIADVLNGPILTKRHEWGWQGDAWCCDCGMTGITTNPPETHVDRFIEAQRRRSIDILAALRSAGYAIVKLGEAVGMRMEDMNISGPAAARSIAAALLAEADAAEADQ